jgi:aspartate/methionine/tyrosine aminotransferase
VYWWWRLQAKSAPKLVHTLCGISKDFCASGLRIGIIHTHNKSLMRAIDNICYFHTVSNPTQWAFAKVQRGGGPLTLTQILTLSLPLPALPGHNACSTLRV